MTNTKLPQSFHPTHDRLLTEREAAEMTGYSMKSFQRWRVEGGGPSFIKRPGRAGSVRYKQSEILRWVDRFIVTNTGESTQRDRAINKEKS